MPTIYSRIFLFYNLIYTIFLSLLPKKLKHYLPSSYINPNNQIVQIENTTSPLLPLDPTPPISSSRMNREDLHRVFQMFDKNGDGIITKQELNDSLENMNVFVSDSDLVKMIEKIDVNGDGCVDLDEFDDLYKTVVDNREENEEDMLEAFNVFDQNRDGFIAVDELRSVFGSLGLKEGWKVEDCRRMIMKVDVDGDGLVCFNEFKQMMRSGGFGNMVQSQN